MNPLIDNALQLHGASQKKAWMITVNDLFSLLISFFVLLYALNNKEIERKQQHSIMQMDKIAHDKITDNDKDAWRKVMSQKKNYVSGILPINYLYRVIANKMTSCASGTKVNNNGNYISILIPMQALFEGQVLTGQATNVLVCLADNLNFIANTINIYTVAELGTEGAVEKSLKFQEGLRKSYLVARSLMSISGNTNINAFAYNKEYSKIDGIPPERIEIVINDEHY